ncbi:MAG: ATP-binding protein [Anaerolineae bacterium]|nr:ATP-binding protein [Anaerolineae bacterium]
MLDLGSTPARDRPALRMRDIALAALATTLPADDGAPEARFLQSYVTESWPVALENALRDPVAADLPLLALADELGLTSLEVLAIALAAAVEEDAMVGRALIYCQSPLGGSRPTLALLASFPSLASEGVHPVDVLVTGAAIRSGILRLIGDGKPLPEQALMIPPPIRLALSDLDGKWPETTIGLHDEQAVPLPPSIAVEIERYARSLQSGHTLVIRAGLLEEGRAAAALLGHTLGMRPAFMEITQLAGSGPWLFLRNLLPVFCLEIGPGERRTLPPLPDYRGPMVVVCGPEGSVETNSLALNWFLPTPSPSERATLWKIAVGNDAMAQELAHHHRHSSGRIARLGRLAYRYSAQRGSHHPNMGDVVLAARQGDSMGLETLAQALRDDVTDEALVVPDTLRDDLEMLYLRCRTRDGLVDRLGISTVTRYVPGVRALFVGPSGTGKTLAAGWLATRLGLPLFRVDLAAVTSKYIGETEKNLAQLLARAEQSEVVLLFDEADSMFGKRTEIKEANDRFANAQTNYLLQRIENYTGITLLTSNSRARFDTAFTRRLDMILEFPQPGPTERRRLWQAHLGEGHTLKPKELNRLAATIELGGGHIRNAVLAAAVLAHEAGRPIAFADLLIGLSLEYRKLGRQLPVELQVVE